MFEETCVNDDTVATLDSLAGQSAEPGVVSIDCGMCVGGTWQRFAPGGLKRPITFALGIA
ncbi:hypothetical protein LJR034_008301 [Caballeronia sp. LjRoot34]